MQAKIKGKRVNLKDHDIIGIGGEATIFKLGTDAVKIYLSPDPVREQKLQAMLQKQSGLPQSVIAPRELVYDEKGKQIIGFTMNLLSPDYTEIRELTKKSFHKQRGISAKEIACLFLNIGNTLKRIHQSGMIVGDLNDLNIMFYQDDALFIDVDSFQFDQYPCMVGTEAFTDPALYGIDLSKEPAFTTENDWYAFAVLFFKALLLTHPYGGIHPQIRLLPHRAQQKISVFHPDVTYPKIAHAPELLSDELANEFQQWFEQGKRGAFPLNTLQAYIHELVTCPHCSAAYPRNRAQCPICSAAIPIAVTVPVSGARTIIWTDGEIIAWHITRDTVRLIAHEEGRAVLYVIEGTQQIKKMELFDAIATARYAFIGEYVAISPAPSSEDLYLVDVSGDQPQGSEQLTTAAFGQGERIFGANDRFLYRIANGYLMRGEFRYGQYVEQAMMAVADQQTWFTVAPDQEKVFGFFRTFNNHEYWLLNGQERIDLVLPQMEASEFIIEISVKFASDSMLILRQTQLQGVERIRIDEISLSGVLLHSQINHDIDRFTPLDAHTYVRNMVLSATDQGIVREILDNANTATFTQTENVVKSGDRIFRYGDSLLALSDRSIINLSL